MNCNSVKIFEVVACCIYIFVQCIIFPNIIIQVDNIGHATSVLPDSLKVSITHLFKSVCLCPRISTAPRLENQPAQTPQQRVFMSKGYLYEKGWTSKTQPREQQSA